MGLYLPQRWKRQPQGPQRIDWNNPHTRGLIVCATPGNGAVNSSYDLVTGRRFEGSSTHLPGTAHGMRSWSGAQYQGPVGCTIPNAFDTSKDRIETAGVFALTSTTASGVTSNGGRLAFFGNSYTNNIGFGVLDVGGNLKPNFRSGSLDDVTTGGFDNISADVTGTTTLSPGRVYSGFSVMTPYGYSGPSAASQEMIVGLNGRVEGSGRYEQYFNDSTVTPVAVHYQDYAGRFYDTFLYAMWRRARGEAERLDWHANPWQLLAPQRATFFSLPAASGPAYIAFAKGEGDSSATTVATDTTLNVAIGDVLIGAAMFELGADTTFSFSDTAGSTLISGTKRTHSAGNLIAQPFALVVTSANAANTVTATFGAARQYRSLVVGQYRGLSGSLVDEDYKNATNADPNTFSTPNLTFGRAGVLVGIYAPYSGASFSVSSPFNERYDSGSYRLGLFDQIISTAGAYPATMTADSGAQDSLLFAMAFQDASGPVLSLPTVIDITSTSVRPRVTITI